MQELETILGNLPEEERSRIQAALTLMNRQGIGSERYREHVQSWTKSDKSPVTVADLLHQSQAQELLADRFPEDGLICEEPRSMQEQVVEKASEVSGKFYKQPLRAEINERPESGHFTWILDPIDGTKGYLAGRYYAIAFGYFLDGRPRFGAMAVPHSPHAEATAIDNRIAFAVAGEGAWIADISEDNPLQFEPLKTDHSTLAVPFKIAVSLEHGGGIAEGLGDRLQVVKMDSQAKYLGVAANAIDAYLRKSRDDGGTDATWDHMPGILIAQEAGALVRSFAGGGVQPGPQPVIDLGGGVMAHRGTGGDELDRTLQEIVDGRT